MVIKYSSAPCGSGKTHNLISKACELAKKGRRVLISQPTRHLNDRTVEDELKTHEVPPPHRIIHGGTVGQNWVAKALVNIFKNPADTQIIFPTHMALPVVPFWANQADWDLLVDEELPAFRYKAHRLPTNHSIITNLIDVDQVNGTYGRVSILDEDGLEEIGRNKERDELFEVIAETVRIILNPHYETYVNLEQYEKLRDGKVKQLAFYSILNPSVVEGFGQVFMTCANFEDTPLYRLWSMRGVTFKVDQKFAQGLRFQEHPNGHLLTIHYGIDQAWSRKRLDTTVGDDGRSTFDVKGGRSEASF